MDDDYILIDKPGEDENTFVASAPEEDNHQILEQLVRGVDSSKDEQGQDMIHKEVLDGQTAAVETLIISNIDLRRANKSGRSLLHAASENGHGDIVRLLVKAGLDVNQQDKNGETPLHLAAKSGEAAALKVLIELSADVSIADVYGRTAEIAAWHQLRTRTIAILSGYDEHSTLDELLFEAPVLPLWVLARIGRDDLVLEAIAHRSRKVDEPDPDNNNTALHWAIIAGHPGIAELLLGSVKMSPDCMNRERRTPLHMAALYGEVTATEILLRQGADINLLDNNGMTALAIAQSHKYSGIEELLVNARSYFECSYVNSTTFVIHEKDKYEEHPFIYVKVFPSLLVLSDTGCGGGTSEQPHSHNLKEFLETCPISTNKGNSLNPRGSNGRPSKEYMIICTHCHYDHILGLNHFQHASPEIVASWEGKSFVENDLSEHSLCKALKIPIPKYTVTHWAHDLGRLVSDGVSLHLQIIHTPGHTPDELAWYDRDERHLYVGDSFYERVAKDRSYEQAIIFPKEGNIIEFMRSLNKLLQFVEAKNRDDDAHKGPIKIGCGHVTSSVDGKEILLAVKHLFLDILSGKVPIVHSEEKRGEEFSTWREDGEPRFSVAAPRRIMLAAQQAWGGIKLL